MYIDYKEPKDRSVTANVRMYIQDTCFQLVPPAIVVTGELLLDEVPSPRLP